MPSVTSWLRGFMSVMSRRQRTTSHDPADDSVLDWSLTEVPRREGRCAAGGGQTCDGVPAAARRVEADGFDGLYTFEGPHDPFLPLCSRPSTPSRVDLMTAVAIAFARNPMTVAQHGVGPAGRVGRPGDHRTRLADQAAHREAVLDAVVDTRARGCASSSSPIRAIWRMLAGRHAAALRRRVLPPHADDAVLHPGAQPAGPPRIFLAGVGPAMTGSPARSPTASSSIRSALADLPDDAHASGTARGCARARTLGLRDRVAGDGRHRHRPTKNARSGRARDAGQIAFYGSTPAYRPVLDHHGWGELQPELNRLSKRGDWGPMMALDRRRPLRPDRGPRHPAECGAELARRTVGLVDRVALNAPYVRRRPSLDRCAQGIPPIVPTTLESTADGSTMNLRIATAEGSDRVGDRLGRHRARPVRVFGDVAGRRWSPSALARRTAAGSRSGNAPRRPAARSTRRGASSSAPRVRTSCAIRRDRARAGSRDSRRWTGRDEWYTPWGGPPEVRSLACTADNVLLRERARRWHRPVRRRRPHLDPDHRHRSRRAPGALRPGPR